LLQQNQILGEAIRRNDVPNLVFEQLQLARERSK